MPIENARIDFRRKPKLADDIKSLSDAEIEARAKADEDAPPLSDEELANLAPATPRPVRDALGLTQEQFAQLFQIPVSTVRDWEQGRVRPDAAGRALLKLIAANPRWAVSVFSGETAASRQQIESNVEALHEMFHATIEYAHSIQQTTEQISAQLEECTAGVLVAKGYMCTTAPRSEKEKVIHDPKMVLRRGRGLVSDVTKSVKRA